MITLNIPDEYGYIYSLPAEILRVIREQFRLPYRLDGPGQISMFCYDNDVFALYAYTGGLTSGRVSIVTDGRADSLVNLNTGMKLSPSGSTRDGGTIFNIFMLSPGDINFYKLSGMKTALHPKSRRRFPRLPMNQRLGKMEGFKNLRLGELLLGYGYITEEQLNTALKYQETHRNRRIGELLIELGYINEKQMLRALAERLSLSWTELEQVAIDIRAAELISRHTAVKYQILPVSRKADVLTVLVNDPLNLYGLEEVRQTSGLRLEVVLTEKEPLRQAISDCYAEIEAKLAAGRANSSIMRGETALTLANGETPIISLLDSLIRRAIAARASDIHIEPFEAMTLVRMRIDGALLEYVSLLKELHSPLLTRIKILAELDIAERRLPQDGHIKTVVNERNINIRVSVVPTVYGEKAVLRILDSSSVIDNAGSFGMLKDDYEKFKRLLELKSGIIYLTGPTGSGKTTTLYMALEYLSRGNVNISTIEDPVEKNIAGVNQMQVNNVAGLTFSTGLRALLRQDPDIIMVGETRDTETASISVWLPLTGHLVLSNTATQEMPAACLPDLTIWG
jgi:type IV pilus assembly protein PilB